MRVKSWGVLPVLVLLGWTVCSAPAEVVSVVLESGDYALDAQTGLPVMEGFSSGGVPGNPQLPGRVVRWALPPEAQMDSVKLEITAVDAEEPEGTFDLPSAPPMATFDTNGRPVISWGETPVRFIRDGRNTEVYEQDAFFPASPAVLLPYGQLRKWQFAQIAFSPVQYNPVTGRIRVIRRMEVTLHYQTFPALNALAPDVPAVWRDDRMTDRAAELLDNYEAIRPAYATYAVNAPTDGSGADFVIITTTAITNGATQLPNLVQHLENRGHSVQVVTEDDYGSLTGQSPDGTAEKIRQWLINNYAGLGIEYVLLIGSPDPDDPSDSSDSVGDVPMKMCWPRRSESSYQESPTDYFYADLTGNWDLDGDGYYGEYDGDRGSGGVDFAAEVIVGRIPVYDGDYAAANTIISRLIAYETDTGDLSWRGRMLLPMAISNYANEDDEGSDRTDGLDLPELMIEQILNPAGHDYHVMYEKEGLDPVPSGAAYDNAAHIGISTTNLVAQWNAGFGTVFWWGHGSETSASRKTWVADDNSDGIPQADEMDWDDFVNSSAIGQITGSCPSLIYMSSCLCGYPENWSNLGYVALRDQAVGVIAASRVSWYAVGTWSFHSQYADNSGIGYLTMSNMLVKGSTYGQALYDAKNAFGDSWDGSSWMNKMDFNLYGLPTLSLTNVSAPRPTLTVSVANPIRSESDPSPIEFVLTSGETVTSAFAVAYGLYGSAGEGQDYTSATATVTFPAGTNTCSFFVYPEDDALAEGAESVVFSLLISSNYMRGTPFCVHVNIMDDETPLAVLGAPMISDDPAEQNNPGDAMDFDLSGGSLASLDQGGFGTFGRVYVNYDATNLYIGGYYSHPGGNDDVLALFLSVTSLTDNAENLWSCAGVPYALDYLHNVSFTPAVDIAILIGDEWGDGTFPNFSIETGTDLGQGVFYLNSVFTPVAGARLSQFDGDGTNAVTTSDDDGDRQANAWEASIPLSSLNAASVFALGEIYISGLALSQATDGNDRYLSGNYLGAGAYCSTGLNEVGNYGYGFVTLTGVLVQAYAPNTAPQVVILAPRNGAEYVQGQGIVFQASAEDAEDGALTNITWTSSLDGLFAQGTSVTVFTLSPGDQTITASVEDSEAAEGTDSLIVAVRADAQTNGLPDAWEEAYWATAGESDAATDSDADGMSNGDEWLAGTDPTDADSVFAVDAGTDEADSDLFLLSWLAHSNRYYSVWVLTNLTEGAAVPLVTNLYSGTAGTLVYTDAVHQADARLYYRIKVEP